LHDFVRSLKIERARKSLETGVSPNFAERYKQNALHTLCQNHEDSMKTVEMAKLLVSFGVDINQKDEYNKTALHYCAEYDLDQTAQFLIHEGAEIDPLEGWHKRTPLHIAAEYNKQKVALVFLENGASIEICSNHGKSAVDYASVDFKNTIKGYSPTPKPAKR